MKDTRYLDPRLLEVTPVMGVEAVKNECVYMGTVALELIEDADKIFFNKEIQLKERVVTKEDLLDSLHRAIRDYADAILQAGISDDAAIALKDYVACSGNLERIGDTGKQLLMFYEYRQKQSRDFSPEAMEELHAMFADARDAVSTAIQGFNGSNVAGRLAEVDAITGRVRTVEAELRAAHMYRLSQGGCDPETGIVFIDVLGVIERMAYRAKKIARTNAKFTKAAPKA